MSIPKGIIVHVQWLEEEGTAHIFGRVIKDDDKRIYIEMYSVAGEESLTFNIPKKDIESITVLVEMQ